MNKELEQHVKKVDRFLKANLQELYMMVCEGSVNEKSYKLVSFRRAYIPADGLAVRSVSVRQSGTAVCTVSCPSAGVIEEEPPRLAVTFVLGSSTAGNILHENFYDYGSVKLSGSRLMCSRLETICIPKPKQDNIEQ